MKLSIEEIIALNRNMHMYLSAGYNVSQVLDIIVKRKLVKGRAMKAMQKIKTMVVSGENMSCAFQKTGCFPQYMVQLIIVGEESGQLSKVFKSLSQYYQEKKNRKKSIMATISYPIFVLVLALGLFLGIVLYFAPMMNSSLGNCNIESNEYMMTLLKINNWLRGNWSIICIIIFLIITLNIFCFCIHNRYSYIILNKLFIIRWVYHRLCSMKFTYFMYLLLNNGVHINKCLEILKQNERDYIIRDKLSRSIVNMKSGEPLYRVLANMKVFPETAIDIISVGEDTAQLENSMYNSYNIQKYNFDESFKKFLTVLQPVLMIMLGIMIFLLIYSIMSPVVESMGEIR